MVRRIAPVLLLSLMACKPTNAELTTGSYTTFLSRSTSPVIFGQDLRPGDFGDITSIDCRQLDPESGEQRLPNPIDVCEQRFEHEAWLGFDGYYIIHEELSAWRGEAVITSEGDLQLTFHHRLPSGEDFRFAFVVNPGFQPKECVQREDGEGVELQDRDGEWLANWSDPEWTLSDERIPEGGTTFFPNAGAYQFNPSDLEDVWTLPRAWRAGYAAARWSGEDLIPRTARYGLPRRYLEFELDDQDTPTRRDLFYVDAPEDSDPVETKEYLAEIEEVVNIADEVEAEYTVVAEAADAEWGMRPVVHTNQWRPYDGLPAGVDGWVELHYNWVHFDQAPEDLQAGEAASGSFALYFEGLESQTRVMLEGTFEIDRIKKDRWVTRDIELEKLEENGTELCGESFDSE